ncbi:hypothetical protein ISN45_Aa01g009440 [Arabidopsis thaliana x Arabidopsis arenosa]|uniref:Uncharacterized protein n=1 Tax=Arabidopsis thaliana x Arabidopsis arenosa TaxID=1240361 RepID=A0A8T2C9A0_9BRAS|nr:hypothetical protein ISN45_Aa01g009440 [Arabidopsis thaliana x Arabidopsis arenosa]
MWKQTEERDRRNHVADLLASKRTKPQKQEQAHQTQPKRLTTKGKSEHRPRHKPTTPLKHLSTPTRQNRLHSRPGPTEHLRSERPQPQTLHSTIEPSVEPQSMPQRKEKLTTRKGIRRRHQRHTNRRIQPETTTPI